jgi:hypothetical protein
MQAGKWADGRLGEQVAGQVTRLAGRQTDGWANRLQGRQPDSQAGRQTDMQMAHSLWELQLYDMSCHSLLRRLDKILACRSLALHVAMRLEGAGPCLARSLSSILLCEHPLSPLNGLPKFFGQTT